MTGFKGVAVCAAFIVLVSCFEAEGQTSQPATQPVLSADELGQMWELLDRIEREDLLIRLKATVQYDAGMRIRLQVAEAELVDARRLYEQERQRCDDAEAEYEWWKDQYGITTEQLIRSIVTDYKSRIEQITQEYEAKIQDMKNDPCVFLLKCDTAKVKDLNGDGWIGLQDLQMLDLCRTGPAVPLNVRAGEPCWHADIDDDDDVDQDDFAELQASINWIWWPQLKARRAK